MEIESLRRAADALEKAGNVLRQRFNNPEVGTPINEAGQHILSAALQLRGAAEELGDILAERKAQA